MTALRCVAGRRARGLGEQRPAVVLASRTGAKLYPVLGYEQIGTLLLFTPNKTK